MDTSAGGFAWPYRADLPQRFAENFARYRARGGLAHPGDDARGFAAFGDTGDIARFLAFTLAFDQIAKEGVAGDVAELGVYRGQTAHGLATFARRLGRHTYLFDTFAGFDPADRVGVDRDVPPGFEDTTLDAVRAFVGTEATTYCVGHFPGTAAMLPGDAAFCLAHIDCDLYAPMLAALDYFYPRMTAGGFIVIHDYTSLAWEGAERAADAFFADKPECLVPMPDGCGSAMVRRQRVAGGATWLDRRVPDVFAPGLTSAREVGMEAVFTSGWGPAEDWGRWGLGEAHVLRLRPPAALTGDVWLEIDGEAVILGARVLAVATVSVGGVVLATLDFTAARNRAVRRVTIPAAVWEREASAGRVFEVTIRPDASVAPASLMVGHPDDRSLGVAVHALRAGAAEG